MYCQHNVNSSANKKLYQAIENKNDNANMLLFTIHITFCRGSFETIVVEVKVIVPELRSFPWESISKNRL